MMDNDVIRGMIRDIQQLKDQRRIVQQRSSVYADATTAAGQSIPHNARTIVNFGTVVLDSHAQITTGAAWRFTAKTAMVVHVSTAIIYAPSTAWALGEWANLEAWVNGSMVRFLDRKEDTNSAAVSQQVQLSGGVIFQLAKNDYLDIRTIHFAGVAIALQADARFNYVSIHQV